MTHIQLLAGLDAVPAYPVVRRVGPADLKDALAKGINDFLPSLDLLAEPLFLVPLSITFVIIPICLISSGLPLLFPLFPLMSGFALVGPFVAVGFYEMSRRRELGLATFWIDIFDLWNSPSLPSILLLGFALLTFFICWETAAEWLYVWLFGPAAPESLYAFFIEIFTTSRGWTLIILGHVIGFVFAVAVLSISVVSFPLLLDRDVGAALAVHTSVRAVLASPLTMGLAAQLYSNVAQLSQTEAARCRRLCKVLGPNRTKMFHVKHFGKVLARNRTKRGDSYGDVHSLSTACTRNPMKVEDSKLRTLLGVSNVTFKRGQQRLAITDKRLEG